MSETHEEGMAQSGAAVGHLPASTDANVDRPSAESEVKGPPPAHLTAAGNATCVIDVGGESSSGPRTSEFPELIFAFAAPVGVDLSALVQGLQESLDAVGYRHKHVKLSGLLRNFDRWKDVPETPVDKRYEALMNAGDEFRQEIKSGDALTMLAVGEMREHRQQEGGNAKEPVVRQAYIFDSLKHPDEVKTLRTIYGSAFVLISGYAPKDARVEELARRIATSKHASKRDMHKAAAQHIVDRDEAESGKAFGQNVRDTFPLADVFIEMGHEKETKDAIRRFVNLLFGYPFETPTREEHGMFHAQAAAFRSSSLARQVGACLTTPEGDVLAVGANEVPKAGGGLYWNGDVDDRRDFVEKEDSNDILKRSLFGEVVKILQDQEWLSMEKSRKEPDALVEEAFRNKLLKGTQLNNILEFSRCVYAEMAAICDAARRGVSIRGATLYSTTFPCHGCAKHIVAAGISRVVFIEPFPKSLVLELHHDSIAVDDPSPPPGMVRFRPFVGISPRRYMDLFAVDGGRRKEDDGTRVRWDASGAPPRLPGYFPSLDGEDVFFKRFQEKLAKSSLR